MADLRLEEVGKSRSDGQGRKVEIVRGVSLHARAGQLTVIIGPSGSGKSTLIRLLNRLEDPEAGRIFLDGINIFELDPLELRRRVALVPQKPFIFPGTVLANLQRPFFFQGNPPPAAEAPAVREVLELCRLSPELLSREGSTLSLGEQQRVALARTLITTPEVLLLDEPTSALDRPTGDRLADTLREVCRRRQLTVLMVTHDLRLAGRVADHLAYLEKGRIIEEGRPADLLERPQSGELRLFLDQPMTEG